MSDDERDGVVPGRLLETVEDPVMPGSGIRLRCHGGPLYPDRGLLKEMSTS